MRKRTPQLEIGGLGEGEGADEGAVVQDAYPDVPYYIAPPQQVALLGVASVSVSVTSRTSVVSETSVSGTSISGTSRASVSGTSVSGTSRTSVSGTSTSGTSTTASFTTFLSTASSSAYLSLSTSTLSSTPSSTTPAAFSSTNTSSPQTLSHGAPLDAAIALGAIIAIACISVLLAYLVRLRSVRHRVVDEVRWSPVVHDAKGGEEGEGEEGEEGGAAMRSTYTLTGDRDVGVPKRSDSFIAGRASAAPSRYSSTSSASAMYPQHTPFAGPQLHRASSYVYCCPAHFPDTAAYPFPPPASAPMYLGAATHSTYTLTGDRDVGEPQRSDSFIAGRASVAPSQYSSTSTNEVQLQPTPFAGPHTTYAYPIPPLPFLPPMVLPSPLPLPHGAMGVGPYPTARQLPAHLVHADPGAPTLTRASSRTGSVAEQGTLGRLRVANATARDGEEEQDQGWAPALRASVSAALSGDDDRERREAGWARLRREGLGGYLDVPASSSSVFSDAPLIRKPARPAAVARSSVGSVYSVASASTRGRAGVLREGYEYS